MTISNPAAAESRLHLTVSDKRYVVRDVVELSLRLEDGGALPAWEAGAHIDLELGPDLIRQYSLLGAVNDPTTWRVAVLKEPESRGGSVAAHAVKPGDKIWVRGPRNHFALAPAKRYLFIAGGIGITPLLPMIAAAEAKGAAWTLAFGGRSAETMAYAPELAEKHPDRVSLFPQDQTGLLPLDTLLGSVAPDTLIYCCGPEPLLTAVDAATKSWPPGSLHVEHFSPREIDDDAPNQPIEVVLAASGLTLQVPADKSILEVVTEAGIDVLTSCQEGTCGTCETTVLEGTPLHRDSILTEGERERGKTMMVCVSRARSAKLVLDL